MDWENDFSGLQGQPGDGKDGGKFSAEPESEKTRQRFKTWYEFHAGRQKAEGILLKAVVLCGLAGLLVKPLGMGGAAKYCFWLSGILAVVMILLIVLDALQFRKWKKARSSGRK